MQISIDRKYKSPSLSSVTIGNKEIFFSYETPVAFRIDGKLVVSENVWSRTTARHLSEIDNWDKENRISFDKFEKALSELFATK